MTKSDEQPKYILIVGQGRSGTNWLLDLLDLSMQTYCRNEANELATSPLAQLPSPVVQQDFQPNFGQQWNQAIALASLRMGERDRIGIHPKFYLYEPVRRLGGANLLGKRRIRRILAAIAPSLEQSEWSVPWWLVNLSALKQATPVLKLNQIPGWAKWVLLNRPATLVIHIIRHPGGFLNSWQNRYLETQEAKAVKQANEERLWQIAQREPEWAKLFGDIGAMSVQESELWYWRYATETIDSTGEGKPNYMRIIYEDLVANPLKVTKYLYQKSYLPWTEAIERKVINSSSRSNSIATAWYEKLKPEQINIVKQILQDSPICQWWKEITL